MSKTKIEWSESVWNPVTGCRKISPGCMHCYAETLAKRLKAMGQANYKNGFDLTLQPHMLDIPLKRKKPTVYFVNSMSDLFHKDVPDEYIDKVFAVMALAKQHTFQILTKRGCRMREFSWRLCKEGVLKIDTPHDNIRLPESYPLPNVWFGVSVENRAMKQRIDQLRQTHAVVRFLSLEPLLQDLGELDLRGIHQVIVGGESGFKARPVHPDWVRSIRDQCIAQGVAFFFKQWGEWFPATEKPAENGKWSIGKAKALSHIHLWKDENENVSLKIGKKNAGRFLDGEIWNEYPRI